MSIVNKIIRIVERTQNAFLLVEMYPTFIKQTNSHPGALQLIFLNISIIHITDTEQLLRYDSGYHYHYFITTPYSNQKSILTFHQNVKGKYPIYIKYLADAIDLLLCMEPRGSDDLL